MTGAVEKLAPLEQAGELATSTLRLEERDDGGACERTLAIERLIEHHATELTAGLGCNLSAQLLGRRCNITRPALSAEGVNPM